MNAQLQLRDEEGAKGMRKGRSSAISQVRVVDLRELQSFSFSWNDGYTKRPLAPGPGGDSEVMMASQDSENSSPPFSCRLEARFLLAVSCPHMLHKIPSSVIAMLKDSLDPKRS
jgi:hypothetical protein